MLTVNIILTYRVEMRIEFINKFKEGAKKLQTIINLSNQIELEIIHS